MSVEIRRAVAADADALREVRLAALLDEPDAFGSTYAESVRYPSSRWVTMAAEWNYFLAWRGAEPLGMASGGHFDPEPQARWLYGMFVRPDARGTTVAAELVRTVATWARGESVSVLGLHVTTAVTRAVRFYEKMGFVPRGQPKPMDRDAALMLQIMTTDLRTNERL